MKLLRKPAHLTLPLTVTIAILTSACGFSARSRQATPPPGTEAPAATEGPTPVRWRKTVIDPAFRSEGVAVADVNKDGRKDVIVGDYWYEAPSWKRHEIRAPRTDLGDGANSYSDAFCCFVGDFNNDGWPDILVVGFPGKPGYWYENPGSALTANPNAELPRWKQHLVVDSVCNETPNYVDLFGDGHKYLVAATMGHMCWLAPGSDVNAPWVAHVIGGTDSDAKAPGTEVFSHGLGFGDVNNDGRKDIIVKQGWWEQMEGARYRDRDTPWTFHPANFGDDCSNIYAFDIDGDGKSDILSASAHGRGIWWFQNDGNDKYTRRLIANNFTETHSMNVADIQGGGHKDFVTGKRWWAHGPHGDIDPNVTPVLYWFEIQPRKGESPRFIAHPIDEGSGVGTQFTTEDVNGDALIDVVVSNKRGVFLFTQEK